LLTVMVVSSLILTHRWMLQENLSITSTRTKINLVRTKNENASEQ
jgi:hypothetical protein